ncbi:MAG: styrene monooxygenase/indole monooxygenase family protein [Rhizobacter sp.]
MSKKRIGIVGAGQAGLLAAHGFLQQGCEVSLYSEQSPDDFLTLVQPTGAAARFHTALEYERELGLNHWEHEVRWTTYAHVSLCAGANNRLMTMCGRLQKPACAIDLRLQSHRWMRDFESGGGQLFIERVSVARLDEIAKENDLTLVAAGRGEIRRVFERDDARSTHTKPVRQLAMVGVTGTPQHFDGAHGHPVKFNLFPDHGECFWMPWHHKDAKTRGAALLVEARPGGPLDKFREAQSAEQVAEILLKLIKEMMPWDYAWARNMQPADANAWLSGTFVPEIKKPVGTLPSGRIVMAVGDAAMSIDPIAGQGANCGNKMVRHLVQRAQAHGDVPFDATWMNATFDSFWQRHHWIDKLTNLFLAPMTDAGKEFLIAGFGSTGRPDDDSPQQRIADAFANNFDDPAQLTQALYDIKEARQTIERLGRRHWMLAKLKGVARIGKGQVMQKLGRDPNHPSTAPFALT